MKCMIIGSNVCKSHEYEKVCAAIGKAIVFCMHDLIVCSPFKDSADYWVANSFLNEKNSKNKCYFYYPNMKNVVTEIGLIRNEFKQLRCIYNKIENLDDPLFSWLFCQLKALEEADYIFALGGKENKSAKLLLSLAEAKNKLIIPFSKFGGASKEYYHTTEYKYQRLDKGYILSQNNIECMPQHICEIIDDLLNFRNSDHVKKIFISYPREKTDIADYLEMILRRRNIIVFRDESDFTPGASIQNEIIQKLNDSNVFISLWCKENACSPWCYDEFEIALDKNQKSEMSIIILQIDDTRMIHPRARDIITYPVNSKKDIQNIVNKIL